MASLLKRRPSKKRREENYRHNLVAEQSKEMQKAKDETEGLIIKQSGLKGMRYGDSTSDFNGCGWIAAYNVRRMLGEDVTPAEVIRDMEDTTLLGGVFGTHPFEMARYLSEQGYDVTCTMSGKNMEKAAEEADAGIYFYMYKEKGEWPRGHNMAFRKSKRGRNGRYTFYNWDDKKEVVTIPELIEKEKPFAHVLITVKRR